MKTINCQRCGKEIEYRGRRKYCIKCRKEVDDEIYILKRQKDGKTKRKRNDND